MDPLQSWPWSTRPQRTSLPIRVKFSFRVRSDSPSGGLRSIPHRPDPKHGRLQFYSGWFPRESTSFLAAVELLKINGTTVRVDLFAKRKERKNGRKAKGQEDAGKI